MKTPTRGPLWIPGTGRFWCKRCGELVPRMWKAQRYCNDCNKENKYMFEKYEKEQKENV